MAQINDVIDMVEELREATGEDLAPHFPNMSIEQIRQCLHKASFQKRIVALSGGSGLGLGKGRTQVVYGPVPRATVVPAAICRMPEPMPICSVWDFGSRA